MTFQNFIDDETHFKKEFRTIPELYRRKLVGDPFEFGSLEYGLHHKFPNRAEIDCVHGFQINFTELLYRAIIEAINGHHEIEDGLDFGYIHIRFHFHDNSFDFHGDSVDDDEDYYYLFGKIDDIKNFMEEYGKAVNVAVRLKTTKTTDVNSWSITQIRHEYIVSFDISKDVVDELSKEKSA
jgi:hypothetical protein